MLPSPSASSPPLSPVCFIRKPEFINASSLFTDLFRFILSKSGMTRASPIDTAGNICGVSSISSLLTASSPVHVPVGLSISIAAGDGNADAGWLMGASGTLVCALDLPATVSTAARGVMQASALSRGFSSWG
mmetsp:Transcript_25066/g.48682  ORF Transcript_25066/g.48682 Transcript_25066/m.48682 type:complete len:132 (+) Transcript_25066:1733-2128(+)|eukprot:2254807-Pleurochrysis_carterae.AAC.3